MITLTAEQAQQIEEALEQLGEFLNAATPSFVDESKSEALSTIRAARAHEQAEQEPVAQQDSDDMRLLREIFMLCEATEEIEAKNDFMRGRIFEAKGIRRSIGTWYQDTFCGRSYMGEPVLNAAPVQQAEQEPVSIANNAPNLFGQVYLTCRENGNSHEGSLAAADEAVRLHGDEAVSRQDLTLIVEQIVRG